MSGSRGFWIALGMLATSAAAQTVPPVVPGFANVPQTAGDLLAGLVAPNQGRTALFAYHNGLLYSIPESPGSLGGSDLQVRSWTLLDPAAPVLIEQLGVTRNPISAHGYFYMGADLVIGDENWTFRATAAPGVNQRINFPGMDVNPALVCASDRGCLFYPWYVGPTLWSYNVIDGQQSLHPRFGQPAASSWNLIEETGVIGQPFIIGNRLYFASDQSRTGVASYDISDPANPVLLDVLSEGGPGGYWPEIFGLNGKLYLVFPYRTNGNGMRVVDITHPADLRFVIDVPLPGAEAMYAQFQDEFAFIGDHKIDMRTFESVLFLDGANRVRTNDGLVGIDTSQFALPLGNLLLTGGANENQGMAIWAHQDAPDTRGPEVAFHVPLDGQSGYPLGAPVTLIIHETLETKTILPGVSLILREVGGEPLPFRVTFAFDDVLTMTPDAPFTPDTSYEVEVVGGGIKDAAGNGIAAHSFAFSTGASVVADQPPVVDAFDANGSPALTGNPIDFTVTAHDPEGELLMYRFDPGDGSPRSEWSTNATYLHAYGSVGHHRASVQVRDPGGRIAAASRAVTVLEAFPTAAPPSGSSLVCLADSSVVAVNPDNDSVARVAAAGSGLLAEAVFDSGPFACRDPRRVAAAGGELWVSCHDNDRVLVLDALSLAPIAAIDLAHGSRPFDVVASGDGSLVFVSSYGRGQLLRFDAASRALTGEVTLGYGARAVAISSDGGSAFVTRFMSPRDESWIWEVDVDAMTLLRTLRLPKFGGDFHRDTSASGRGVANYLADIAVAPGGERLWFVATKPNVDRGPLIGPDLTTENTVRTVAVELDTATGALTRAIDIDNSDSASALGFSPLGDYLFVALQGNQQVAVFDLLAPGVAQASGALRGRLATGHAPQGLCVDGEVVWAQNLLGRGVTRIDISALLDSGDVSLSSLDVSTVSAETMPAEVFAGKRIFYDAADPRMTSDGYISCASCHLDGGHDGRVWDFSGRGEGLRRTIDLRGRGGMAHGKVHWSANFDEIQDFENDMRLAFGGSGFLSEAQFTATSDPLGAPKAGLSAELDALAAYVTSLDENSLPRSPYRSADGALSALAGQGAVLFEALGCHACHAPPRFTRSPLLGLDLIDVGTLSDNSGGRLGGALTGIDVPTLFGLFDTRPFFHDGAAPSLEEVFNTYGGQVIPAESGVVAGGAFVENQFLQFNADDTVRGRALVNLNVQGARVTFTNVDGGAGGSGSLALRYSASASQLAVRVNGVEHVVAVPTVGNPTFRPSNWRYLRLVDIDLNPGPVNQIEIERLHPFARIELDEIVVGTSSERLAAEPHRLVTALDAADRDALLRFLLEIEPGVAVGDPREVFADGFE